MYDFGIVYFQDLVLDKQKIRLCGQVILNHKRWQKAKKFGTMTPMQKIKSFLKTRTGVISVIVVLILASIFAFRGKSSVADAVVVSKGDFTKVVSVTGKVVSINDVDLSFETGGTVSAVYKKVGDTVKRGEIIATLNSADLIAQRDIAEADLDAAKAELQKIDNSSSSDVSVNKEQAVNTIVDAYTKSDDAIHSKVDQFFDDARTTGPKIRYTFYDYFSTKGPINDGRYEIESELLKFKILADNLTVDNYSDQKIKDAKMYVQKIKAYLDLVAPAVNSFEESSALTRSAIDGFRGDVATARSNINTALSNLTTYEDKIRGSLSDASVQAAKVASKEANVRSYNAQIAKTIIYAPFDGIVSLQDAKVGESVAAHTKVSALISSNLQLEVFIPEISIPGIKLDNNAVVTLDAYPDTKFDAIVTHVDPAETVKDGVSNYKVNLEFINPDPRVRSGLTGDVSIETEKRTGVLSVGERSIVTDAGKYYVYLKTKDDPVKTEVTLGIKDGKGNVEILDGITEGESILLNPPTN